MTQHKSLSRRTVLRGASAALGLPFLNAMLPNQSVFASNDKARPVRLAWVFFPNGTNPDHWMPKTDGGQWELSESLKPLAKVKEKVSLLTGLAQVNARSLGDGPGDHARSAAAFLTGSHPLKTSGANMRVGKSADQIAADFYGRDTRLPSIELGTEAGRAAGSCDSGYACAYSNAISWRTPSQPMAKEVSPRLAFQRLFGNGAAGAKIEEKELLFQRSILDIVASDAKQLSKKLGVNDRQKLDEYFTSVRDVEKRIDRMTEPLAFDVSGEMPDGEPVDIKEHIRLMYDMMVLAFKTDTTRIGTFMLGNEGSGKTYPMIGVKEGHHQLSHHQNDEHKVEKIRAIDKFFAEQFAYFLEKMQDTPDGDGTSLLDNSMIVYGGCIRDGNRHDHHDLPILLAGSGGNQFKPGLHREFATETPLNNLYLTMLNSVGVKGVDEFGDSTGTLSF